ncbi:MAG: Crp/Fnr family transcriptional regulator [Vicinamibacterales bacterium]
MATRTPPRPFDAERFLHSAGVSRRVLAYEPGQTIFTQGERCSNVLFIQHGTVKISVLSKSGKEAVVALLGADDFFGEGCLAGQPIRIATATAVSASRILAVSKRRMLRLLHSQRTFSDRFISHLLARNTRIEADLVDQLFNSSEKRLARALLLLARYGKSGSASTVLPRLSQEVLAEMVGTTRSRVNFFMNKFRTLGFIDYSATKMTINNSLIGVVLHD